MLMTGLQEMVNQFLRLDQNSHKHLADLEGKSVALNFRPFDITLYWHFKAEGIELTLNGALKPDVIFTGTPIAFSQMGLSRSHPMRSFLRGDVHVHGDTTVAQSMQHLLADMDIDWEEQVSHLFGDTVAHQLGRLARGGKRWVEAMMSSTRHNVTEYLQEESRHLPTRLEVNHFMTDVDELRMASERLNQRFNQLK